MIFHDINMPELPEVETVKNVLNPILKNRKILSIDVLKTTNIIGDNKIFVSSLTGECFTNVTRIGKYLIFHLTNDKVIISHLRMEGKYYELDENDKNSHYSKVVFHLDNGKKICYDDSRGFGQLKLSSEKDYLNEKEIAKLGPSPFEVDNIEKIYNLAKDRKDLIKALLQSQEIISGLGNIYVDEVLFRCKIHPHTKANLLNKNDWKNIIEQSCIVLDAAIKAGGSTIKSYHPGKDIDGKFQNSLKVYGKAGEKCPICGKTLRFIKTNGRGTTFCPCCQHKLGKPLVVGLTGVIGSGKSKAIEWFNDAGFFTINCDEIVRELYKDNNIISNIQKLFNTKEKLDKEKMRIYLKNDKNKRALQRFLYPIVVSKVKEIIKKNKSNIYVVEAPLLFDANMEDIFDTIIVVTTNEENQIDRLNKRGQISPETMIAINKKSSLLMNINKAEFVIENNGTKEEFFEKINSIISELNTRLN